MNHVASPDNSDSAIERQIQAKGLTAPRVVPAALQAVIVSEHYFTAADGAGTANGFMAPEHHSVPEALQLLTICVLVLRNGFTVLGKSACASPKNFDADIGKSIARKNAEDEIWPLLGYQLKEQLFQMQQPAQSPDPA